MLRDADQLITRAMAVSIAAAGSGVPEHEVAAAVHHAWYTRGGQHPGLVPSSVHCGCSIRSTCRGGTVPWSPDRGCSSSCPGVSGGTTPSWTVYIGDLPEGAADAHAAALAGFDAAHAALRPGVPTGEVYTTWQRAVAASDASARCVITASSLRLSGRHRLPAKLGRRRRGTRHPAQWGHAGRAGHDISPDVLNDRARRVRHRA
ncbi:MAG: M24 family metallopeptidase, partial [Haloechinothrix sp.]